LPFALEQTGRNDPTLAVSAAVAAVVACEGQGHEATAHLSIRAVFQGTMPHALQLKAPVGPTGSEIRPRRYKDNARARRA